MTAILGISAYYHDSAAALVVDGQIVAAAQEERFSRCKHDSSFPRQAIEFCLRTAGIAIDQLDLVGFYEKPLVKFDRLLETHLSIAPSGYSSFRRSMPIWVSEKLRLTKAIRRGLDNRFRRRIVFCDHHQSHAASAFFPSPFENAAILTVDGVGEWSTACYGTGCQNHLTLTHELRFPHSLGLLYSAFTEYLGFGVNDGEYKVMGLAPIGEPKFADLILEKLLDLQDDGSFRMNLEYFNYCGGLTMTNRRFHRLFGNAPRVPESEITQHHKDVAASIQVVAEKIMLKMVCHVHSETGMSDLVMAGGVALNSVANRVIARDSPFARVWIQPAAGDAGGALGAALLIYHQLYGMARHPHPTDQQRGSFLGPGFTEQEIQTALTKAGAVFKIYDSDEETHNEVASQLAEQRVVAWFQGRMEYGPRALGARSILADPRDEGMRHRLNEKVKRRESFRPFAPVVLREHAVDYFDVSVDQEFPYMQFVADVRTSNSSIDGACRKGVANIPAVTHVDRSARLQTADEDRHPQLRSLLESFLAQTGCAVLVNTSFNIRGEPMVCSPEDAVRCFLATDIDSLVLGRHLLNKEEQSAAAIAAAKDTLSDQITDGNHNDAAQRHLHQLLHPTETQLKKFGCVFVPALPLLAWLWAAGPQAIIGCAITGLLIAATGCLVPRILKPVYLVATVPLVVLLSEFVLLGIYLLLLLPLAIIMRFLGRDSLQCRTPKAARSFWLSKEQPKDMESYFRQS